MRHCIIVVGGHINDIFAKKFIEQFPPSKAQSAKSGCAFSLSAPYSEERRERARQYAKKTMQLNR